MGTVTKTLDALIDQTIYDLMAPGEQGLRVVPAADIGASDTTFSLVDASGVNPTDVIEFGNELMLISAKSSDATPVFTASRGYYGTTPAAHTAASTVGHVNPQHPRIRIAEAIKRSLTRLHALGLPLVKSVTDSRETDLSYIALDDDVLEVYRVLYWGTNGRLIELDGWEFYESLPSAKFTNGKALNLPLYVANADELEIVYRAPYRWSTHPSAPAGDSTIELPEGAEDLPSLYAAAWLMSSVEMSRADLNRSEEWGRTEQFERGQSSALVRAKWQEFYRALDEARRVNVIPTPIHYKNRPKL